MVTPEMLKAGVNVLETWYGEPYSIETFERLASDIYEAMEAAMTTREQIREIKQAILKEVPDAEFYDYDYGFAVDVADANHSVGMMLFRNNPRGFSIKKTTLEEVPAIVDRLKRGCPPVCNTIIDLWNLLNPEKRDYRNVIIQSKLMDSTCYLYMEDKHNNPVGFVSTQFDTLNQLADALQYAHDHYVMVD